MTLGITGVFWLPRTATVNSIALWAGPGPIPLGAAAPAWTAIAASYADATTTLARVMAELAVGWQGLAGDAAIARIAPFMQWGEEMTATAGSVAAKAEANAAAETIARITMPSLPEIAVVKAAKAAAYGHGGVVDGTAEAAEAADRAMDIRAALVMNAYEAATTAVVITPADFLPAPPIADGIGAAAGSAPQNGSDATHAAGANPVQAAAAAAGALVQNPGVVAQAGQIAGSTASTAASAVTNVGGAAVSAVTGNLSSAGSMPSMGGMGGLSNLAGGGTSNLASASTRAVSFGGSAVGGGVNLPTGWGGGLSGGGSVSGNVPGGAGEPANVANTVSDGMANNQLDSMNGVNGRGAGNNPMMGRGGAGALGGHGDDEDDERETPSYLKNFEHFADGRTVIPSVIGGDQEHA